MPIVRAFAVICGGGVVGGDRGAGRANRHHAGGAGGEERYGGVHVEDERGEAKCRIVPGDVCGSALNARLPLAEAIEVGVAQRITPDIAGDGDAVVVT